MKNVGIRHLKQASPGTSRSITILRYGKAEQRPKAYLQAGLHADEAPGYLVLHHLLQKLDEADSRGEIEGEIIVVPAANPIGLSQWREEILHGRFDFANSINFNRQHHDLFQQVGEKVGSELGTDPGKNIDLVRSQTRKLLEEFVPQDEAASLKNLLFSLSHDADIVLDLHCDHQAVLHVYLGTPLWPEAADLSAQLGAAVTLLATDSGGTPFDEANSRLWWKLAEMFPDRPIPSACLSATVELRGICDTDKTLAAEDADNLFHFLQRRGVIGGEPPPLPALPNEATPLTGVDYIKAPVPGVIVFLKEPGDHISRNDVLAEIYNPMPGREQDRVTRIRSVTDGILFARIADRFARPGRIIAKVAGKEPLREEEGALLTL